MRLPREARLRARSALLTLVLGALLVTAGAQTIAVALVTHAPQAALTKTDFDVIEGVFHDGLGTFAELVLANELIEQSRLAQPRLDTARSQAKMRAAISQLPQSHPSRAVFEREILNITKAAKDGAVELLKLTAPSKLTRVRHTALEFAEAKAGDIKLEFSGGAELPVSVKTDKSGKVAVAEGQTPHIEDKWAERYFRVRPEELNKLIAELGFASMADMKTHYLNVARLVAAVLIRKLGLVDCKSTDFSRARSTDLGAVKYLLRQLVLYKSGRDKSRVIIFNRSTGEVEWESLLDGVDIEELTADRISFLPSRPQGGHTIASEFGIKIDGRTIVSFQVKHKRGSSRNTIHRYEFSDITTRLRI